jgi:hypothetical protein
MLQFQQAGQVPTYLETKIEQIRQICEFGNFNPFQNGKWKKVKGLKNAFSYWLTANHRILFIADELFFVSDHDRYERKIENIKKVGGYV